jgi:acetate kinase
MASTGEVRALMKGSLHTDQFMHAIIAKENQLRTQRLLSHCMPISRPTYARRVVVAHLGGGCSLCAMLDGKSIETSMGFSAIEGLPMSTRVGEIDAGILLHLMKADRMDAAALEQLLYKEAGLLGISGVSGDMRELEESQAPEAAEAIDYFVYHIVKFVGAYTAVLGGLDALVFTAGIGENAPLVRAKVCDKLGWLGVTLDAAANDTNGPRISAADCAVTVWVIPTNEELMIARHTLALAIPVPASDADAKQASNAAIGSDVAGRHRERRKGEQT